jgi:hypothetical protein
MKRMAALNRPPTSPQTQAPPAPKMPIFPPEFADRMRELIGKVENAGLPVDRAELVERGKAEFVKLLALDQACRAEQGVFGPQTDFTSWPSVLKAFQANSSLSTPLREPKGETKAYHRAARIDGFADLWKAFENEPRPIRALGELRRCLKVCCLVEAC